MRRLFLLGVLLTLSLHLYRTGIPMLTTERVNDASHMRDKIAAAVASTGYILPEAPAPEWLRFPLPPATREVKVLTHAGLPLSAENDVEKRYWYRLRCRIENVDGHPLADFRYHHYAGLTFFREPETGEVIAPRFYLDSGIVPADGKIMPVHFDNFPGLLSNDGTSEASFSEAAFISFRLEWKDPSIHDALIRVYTKEKVSERKLGYLWRRLSPVEKAYLAKGNVYPPDFMTGKEKYHVLHHMWQPLGPLGVETVDYVKRQLYILKDIEGDPVQEAPIPPQGFLVDRRHRGIVPLPEGGGRIRLEILGIGDNGETNGAPGGDLRLRWFGAASTDRGAADISWSGDGAVFERMFEGGLIEIETNRDIVVRAFLLRDGDSKEITPDPFRVRAYFLGSDTPVIYDIAHQNQRATPFRLDLRLFRPSPADAGFPDQATVEYALLDMANAVLEKGTILISADIARHDWLSGRLSDGLVSEPTTRFFNFSPAVARVRLTSEAPVMASAYNRLPGMTKKTRVPDDYYAYSLRDDNRQPSWFSFRPAAHERLVLSNRSPMLITQPRPPEIEPELEAGHYKWTSFTPETPWRGRYLFVPKEPGESIREEQLSSVYRRLPANREATLTFRSMAAGRRTVRPSLVFFRRDPAPARIAFFLDGRPFHRIGIAGKRGELNLPAISLGRRRVRISSPPDIRWYINHAGGGHRPYLKRFAKRIGPGPAQRRLEFVYEKPGPTEEVLMVHLFSPLGSRTDATLRARVLSGPRQTNAPLEDWSLLDRRYIVRPDRSGRTAPSPVLHTQNDYTDPGRLLFLPMGRDLPSGRYRVRFDLENGPGGYMIFSKITLGQFEKRDFFRERGIQNEDP